MKKNKINLILIISTIIFVFFIGIFIFLLNIIKNKNEHTSVVMATLSKNMADKENINTLQKKINEFDDINKKIDSYIVDTASIDTFVEFLEKVGVDNGVILTVNGVDIPKNEKNKISVRLSIKGDFSKIMKTVAGLENSPYYMNIVSSYINKEIKEPIVDVTNPSDELKNNLWQADLTFSVLSK
ncbi:MAG: hypothetical protein WCI91_02480 [Candidatus Nomurabacteria bacterium]